jgi:hypothetical protein
MPLKIILLVTILVIISQSFLHSQLRFHPLELGKVFNSGTALSAADINGDQLPDLICIHNSLEIWYGVNTGTSEFLWQKLDEVNAYVWSVNVADLDNNSYNDIIISGEYFGVIVYYQDSSGFEKTYLDHVPFFSQAATVFDVNKDGFLDLTICDEEAKTRFYRNFGNKDFKLDTQLINFSIQEKDSEAGNYGCIWSDINGDHNPDLYISRCRPDVKDSSDRRRRNLFYYNDQGNFIEQGELRKIGILDQSWVSDIGDLDGDGLQDLVVLNHHSACNIFRQLPDLQFENKTIESGFDYNGTPLQISLQDFDNDMDLDILIAGDRFELWLNDGKMHFTKSEEIFLNQTVSSFCIADFNQDGMLDFNASFSDLVNEPNLVRDRVFLSANKMNNFIGFSLAGIQSNRNGIGTQLRMYTKGICLYRELRCGESYGIQNTQQVHFGLGSNQIADSLIVWWPDGREDRYYNLMANDYYTITENTCISKKTAIFPDKKKIVCGKDKLEVKATDGISKIRWNTSDTTNSIFIDKQGVYFYHAVSMDQCPITSNTLYAEYNPIENPKLNLSKQQLICADEELEVYVRGYTDLIWNDHSNSPIRILSDSGSYFALVKGACDSFNTDTLDLQKAPYIPAPVIRDTVIPAPGPVYLESNQEKTRWFNDVTDINPIFEGKVFYIPTVSKPTQIWVESYEDFSLPVINGGLSKPDYKFGPFHSQNINGGLFFSVQQDCILESVVVYTDREGSRRILIQDENLNTLDSMEYVLIPGMNLLQLNFHLASSLNKYFLTTSTTLNNKEFLSNSPWLFRSEVDFSYPIPIQDVCTILYSGSGESEYQYFYDIKIRKLNKNCSSNRIPVRISLENTSNTNYGYEQNGNMHYYNGTIYFTDRNLLEYLILFDNTGKEVFKLNLFNESMIHLKTIPYGLYFVHYKLKQSKKTISEKIIID